MDESPVKTWWWDENAEPLLPLEVVLLVSVALVAVGVVTSCTVGVVLAIVEAAEDPVSVVVLLPELLPLDVLVSEPLAAVPESVDVDRKLMLLTIRPTGCRLKSRRCCWLPQHHP